MPDGIPGPLAVVPCSCVAPGASRFPADRSFSSTLRHFAMNSCIVMGAGDPYGLTFILALTARAFCRVSKV